MLTWHTFLVYCRGAYPNPTKYADVVTQLPIKFKRAKRRNNFTNKEDLIKKFNSAIFPGLQGGPLMMLSQKAVCFKELCQMILKSIQTM